MVTKVGSFKTEQFLRLRIWFLGNDKRAEKPINVCLACQVTVNSPAQEPYRLKIEQYILGKQRFAYSPKCTEPNHICDFRATSSSYSALFKGER